MSDAVVPALTLPAAVDASIRDHGCATYPNECCGALFGDADTGVVVATLALPNKTEEGPRRRFLVRPEDYLQSERQAARQQLALLGFYHSHPDHPARPSEHDLAHAWPSFHYIIVAIREGRAEAMTSWRLQDDRSAFFEEPVLISPGA